MNEKKHIDRLFQEKLKDFQASPSDAVWENISSKLQHQEKGKTIIPLWLRIAGVAAVLLLLVAVGSVVFGGDNSPVENTIVNTEEGDDTNSKRSDSETTVSEDDQLDRNTNLDEDEGIASEEKSEVGADSSQELEQKADLNRKDPVLKEDVNNNKAHVVDNTPKSTPILKKQQKNNVNTTENSEENAVANQNDNKPQNLPTQIDKSKNQPNQIDRSKADELMNNKSAIEKAVVKNETEQSDAAIDENTNPEEKSSIADAITEQEELTKDEEEKEKIQRWSVAPMVGPVYYNAFGNGSAIDEQFNNNPRSGDINITYGLAANYKLSDKLSIRAGINKMNLGYSTNNVIVYNNVDPLVENPPLKHVRMNAYGQTLSFLSADGLDIAQVPGVVSNNIQSSIDQRFGFIEVPMELEYKLSDKKVDISVIGGFSSLFLSENEVYTTLQGEETLLGEATNVRKTSFSANLGVGFNFKVSDKINLNLEPVMKYQLNTFNDTSGDFNPYTLGVQTGFSFKF